MVKNLCNSIERRSALGDNRNNAALQNQHLLLLQQQVRLSRLRAPLGSPVSPRLVPVSPRVRFRSHALARTRHALLLASIAGGTGDHGGGRRCDTTSMR